MAQHPYDARGERQVFYGKPIVLTDLRLAFTESTVLFTVPVPDSRLRTKVTVLFDPSNTGQSIPVNITGTRHALWLGLAEEDYDGRQTDALPVADLITDPATGLLVPRSNPITIPFNANLMGYSQEFVTAGDNIWGELTTRYTSEVSVPGRWILYTRYQPEGVYLPPNEWDEVRRFCTPSLKTPKLVSGGGNS